MTALFVTPFFTSKPLTGFENAILRDYEDVKFKYNSAIVVCSSCRNVDASIEIIVLKNTWLASFKLLIQSPLSMIARLKNARLCFFIKDIIMNQNYSFVHLNQPWIFYGPIDEKNLLLQVRFHNDDVKYMQVLAKLETNIFLKFLLLLESIKVIYLLKKIDSTNSQLICYTKKDVIGLKKYLPSTTNIRILAFPITLLNDIQHPTSNSRIVFFGGDNRPNRESLTWLEKNFCPSIDESIDLYSSSESLLKNYQFSPWIKSRGYSKDMLSLYPSPPIFVFPVFSGSGIKMKVVDAVETGCYVITTLEGAAGLGDQHNNLIVLKDFSVKKLFKNIENLRKKNGPLYE